VLTEKKAIRSGFDNGVMMMAQSKSEKDSRHHVTLVQISLHRNTKCGKVNTISYI
jgi:hypothetical protein